VQQEAEQEKPRQGTCPSLGLDDQMTAPGVQEVLHIGGKNFTIPEQAAILLQQAFEAMKESSGQNNAEASGTHADKGKNVSDPDSTLKQSKGAGLADVPESSKQAEIMLLRCVMLLCTATYVLHRIMLGPDVLSSERLNFRPCRVVLLWRDSVSFMGLPLHLRDYLILLAKCPRIAAGIEINYVSMSLNIAGYISN
jgi:hypothetical protein